MNNNNNQHNLEAQYADVVSYYGKAKVERQEDGTSKLYSYGVHVATANRAEGTGVIYDWASQTTGRHIREFFTQENLSRPGATKAELLAAYKANPKG